MGKHSSQNLLECLYDTCVWNSERRKAVRDSGRGVYVQYKFNECMICRYATSLLMENDRSGKTIPERSYRWFCYTQATNDTHVVKACFCRDA